MEDDNMTTTWRLGIDWKRRNLLGCPTRRCAQSVPAAAALHAVGLAHGCRHQCGPRHAGVRVRTRQGSAAGADVRARTPADVRPETEKLPRGLRASSVRAGFEP